MADINDKEYHLVKVEGAHFKFILKENPAIKFVKLTERGSPGLTAYQVALKNGFVGTESQWLDSLKETSNSRYDFSIFVQGPFYSGEEIYSFACVTPFRFLTNLEGSKVHYKTRPLTNFTIILQKNGVQFGRIVFTNDSNFAYFDSDDVIFNVNDIFTLLADSVVDPNLTNTAIVIAAYRYLYGE